MAIIRPLETLANTYSNVYLGYKNPVFTSLSADRDENNLDSVKVTLKFKIHNPFNDLLDDPAINASDHISYSIHLNSPTTIYSMEHIGEYDEYEVEGRITIPHNVTKEIEYYISDSYDNYTSRLSYIVPNNQVVISIKQNSGVAFGDHCVDAGFTSYFPSTFKETVNIENATYVNYDDLRVTGLRFPQLHLGNDNSEYKNIQELIKDVCYDTLYPVGSICVTGTESYDASQDPNGTIASTTVGAYSEPHYDTLKDPEELYGIPGPWELVDKGWSYRYYNNKPTLNTTNCTSCDVFTVYQTGHTAMLRITWVNKTAHSDTSRTIMTITPKNYGVTSWSGNTINTVSIDDGQNGISQMALTSAGALNEVDFISRATSIPTTTGGTNSMVLDLVIPSGYMLDKSCDLFYWKRNGVYIETDEDIVVTPPRT